MPHWKVYAGNQTCYILEDGTLVEAFKIGKREGDGLKTYFRSEEILSDHKPISEEDRKRIMESIPNMKGIAQFFHQFLYDREYGMNFHGLAKKIEDAGELALVESRPLEEAEDYRATAQAYLRSARSHLSARNKDAARISISEGLKYDPDNIELETLLTALSI